jgi:hypothetical protein
LSLRLLDLSLQLVLLDGARTGFGRGYSY